MPERLSLEKGGWWVFMEREGNRRSMAHYEDELGVFLCGRNCTLGRLAVAKDGEPLCAVCSSALMRRHGLEAEDDR